MTKSEYIAWVKGRALEYVEIGDAPGALASIQSDLFNRQDMRDHAAIELGMMLAMSGHLSTPEQMREFIDGIS